MVVYEPYEVHGMRAVDEELVLLATITPRPGARSAEAVTIARRAAQEPDFGGRV